MVSKRLVLPASALELQAERELAGVGDAALGEWRQYRNRTFHLRRRLSDAEAAVVGPVLDIRRTDEARSRVKALGRLVRLAPPGVMEEEVGLPG